MFNEKQLVTIINRKLEQQNIVYANEIRMGVGIPDIMILEELKDNHILIDDYYVLAIYNLIFNKKINHIEELLKYNYYSANKTKKIVKSLIDSGIIVVENSHISIKRKIPINNLQENISIEVKVKDWKNGLLQAQRYILFSDYSYLALYDKFIKNVKMNIIKDCSIGLISISSNEVKILIDAKKSNECDLYYKYISISNLMKQKNIQQNNRNRDSSINCVI